VPTGTLVAHSLRICGMALAARLADVTHCHISDQRGRAGPAIDCRGGKSPQRPAV